MTSVECTAPHVCADDASAVTAAMHMDAHPSVQPAAQIFCSDDSVIPVAEAETASESEDGGDVVGTLPTFAPASPDVGPRRYSRPVSESIRMVARQYLPQFALQGESYRFVKQRNWVPSGTLALEDLRRWTVDRVHAYESHTGKYASWRIALFPLVSLIPSIAPFLVPYPRVEDGFSASVPFFVSLAIGAWLVYFAPIAMISNLTKIPIRTHHRVLVTFCCAFAFGLSSFLLAKFWVYPVPFVTIIGAFPGFVLCVALVYLLVPKRLRSYAHTRKAILVGVSVSLLSLAMMLAWAGVRVAFVAIEKKGQWQTLLCMSIPILKHLARALFKRLAATVDPDLSASFTFIVEFFNGIFVTTMLADATLLSGLFLVSIEFLTNVCKTVRLCTGKSVLSLAWEYLIRKPTLQAHAGERHRSSTATARTSVSTQTSTPAPLSIDPIPKRLQSSGMLPLARSSTTIAPSPMAFARSPAFSTSAPITPVRAGRRGSPAQRFAVAEPDVTLSPVSAFQAPAAGEPAARKTTTRHGRPGTPTGFYPDKHPAATHEANEAAASGQPALDEEMAVDHNSNRTGDDTSGEALSRNRTLLHRAELLILAEYVELFVPVQYLVFMIFAWYGYNKHAFTLTDSVESDSELWAAFAWVILLVVMDFGSTALTHVAVARVQKINMTRLLSFVLSEHWWFLISNVALMYIFVISLALRPAAADFTFKFEGATSA